MPEDRVRCTEAGCTEYLSKPISRAKLLGTAARFLKASVNPAPISPPLVEVPAPVLKTEAGASAAGLQSEFANEPTVSRLLVKFIDRLPERVTTLATLLQEKDLAALRQAVHQLKGAGGGYGFPTISEVASVAEDHLKVESDLDLVARDIESLIHIVRTVQGYDRTRERVPQAA